MKNSNPHKNNGLWSVHSSRRMEAMHVFLAVFLCLALLAETFPKSLVLLDYYLDTEAYAAYCINKDNPEMECNGMCQLDEMMHKMDEHHHHHDHSTVSAESMVIVYTVPEIIIFEKEELPAPGQNILPFYTQVAPQAPYQSLLRPPQNLFS